MVSSTGLRILATAITASMLATTSQADFHILGCDWIDAGTGEAAMALGAFTLRSDRYTCDGMNDFTSGAKELGSFYEWDGRGQPPSFMKGIGTICGKKINLYQKGDKFDYYEAGVTERYWDNVIQTQDRH